MKYRAKTTVALEPVSVSEAFKHLRIAADADEEGYINSLITAAREYCEGITRRSLILRTYDAFPERFGGRYIELPRPPLVGVESIIYTGSSGADIIMPVSDYIVDTDSEPGRIILPHNGVWPALMPGAINPIKITYTAGYGEGDMVPESIRQSMLLLIGHWYANREAVGDVGVPIAFAVDNLLSMYKSGWF